MVHARWQVGAQVGDCGSCLLAVGGGGAVLASVVAIEEGLGDGVGFGFEGEGAVGHAGDGFEDDGVVGGLVGGTAPDEGGVSGDEAGGDGEGIDGEGVGAGAAGVGAQAAAGVGGVGGVTGDGSGLDGAARGGAEEVDDGEAGLVDVAAADSFVGEGRGDGDGAVEVVGVGGAEGGDGEAGLGEGGGVLGVGVDDGADLWELAVEEGVGVEVGGGAEVAFDDVAVEVGDDHVLGAEVVVADAGRLDDDEASGAVDAGGVAEGVEDEAALNQFEVGFEDLFAELGEEHGGWSLSLVRGLDSGVPSPPVLLTQSLRKTMVKVGVQGLCGGSEVRVNCCGADLIVFAGWGWLRHVRLWRDAS